jgi:hypothetical protein
VVAPSGQPQNFMRIMSGSTPPLVLIKKKASMISPNGKICHNQPNNVSNIIALPVEDTKNYVLEFE